MQLREVNLRNWRSYRSATFRFPPVSARKRVILIGAMNGTGKTSLLMAFYLGLFGREALHLIEGIRAGGDEEERSRSYKEQLRRILHRPAIHQADDPSASVDLLFDVDGGAVRVTRTWHFNRGGSPRDLDSPEGEEIRIESAGRPKRAATWQEANEKIASLLFPSHIMPCYFFDGEQAQARVESSGAHALQAAVDALFGTNLVSQLGDSLKTYINNQKQSSKRDHGDVREDLLEQHRQERDQLQERLTHIQKELPRITSELERLEAGRREQMAELTQLTGDQAVDLSLQAQKKADIDKRVDELAAELRDGIADLALPMALRRFGEAAVKRLDAEIVRDRWLLLRDETLAKVDEIVARAVPPPGDPSLTPPLDEAQHEALAERLRRALESLYSPAPDGCAEEFRFTFLGASDRVATVDRLRTAMGAARRDVSAIANDWQAARAQQRQTQRRWDELRSVEPRIRAIKEKVTELDEKVKEASNARIAMEQEGRGIEPKLRELKAVIGQMESLKRHLEPVREKLEVAQKAREVVEEARDQLIPLCRERLAERCTHHFHQMITGEYQRYQVAFDGANQAVLQGPSGSTVYVATMSGAQKRAFGLAFSLAVADVSGQEAPLVIDTPVGNMDSEYRKRVLSYLARTAPGQVIFLSHNEEIYGEYEAEIDSQTLARYLVTSEPVGDGVVCSTVQDGRYFARRR